MDMQEALHIFLAESRELLQDMEASLLALSAADEPAELINAVFRAAHTIKGSSGLFNLHHIVAFTHVAESVLDRVRDGRVALDAPLVALLLSCGDHIGALIEGVAAGQTEADPALAAQGLPLLDRLRAHLDAGAAPTWTLAPRPPHLLRRLSCRLRHPVPVPTPLTPMSSSSPVLCGRAVPAPGAPPVPISQAEFVLFQRWILEMAGITLPGTKQALVANRLARRLALHGLHSYRDYFALLQRPGQAAEVQVAVDLLTTNETYFFREPKHFDFLRQQALGARGRAQPFRVWSAASSSGEEAYSIAMVLADCLGDATPWEVMGSDISTRVLQGAQRAHYPLERARHIPGHYLKRFCLKGGYEYLDTLLIKHPLRRRVNFRHINLNAPLPPVGAFDVVFLRNVMIYFNHDTRREVATRVLAAIKPGGHFLVGHSESLTDIVSGVQPLAPSIYRKLPG